MRCVNRPLGYSGKSTSEHQQFCLRCSNTSGIRQMQVLTSARRAELSGTRRTSVVPRPSPVRHARHGQKGCAVAGVMDLTFHDLRGTTVTHLAVAGCTVPISRLSPITVSETSARSWVLAIATATAVSPSPLLKSSKREQNIKNDLQNAEQTSHPLR